MLFQSIVIDEQNCRTVLIAGKLASVSKQGRIACRVGSYVDCKLHETFYTDIFLCRETESRKEFSFEESSVKATYHFGKFKVSCFKIFFHQLFIVNSCHFHKSKSDFVGLFHQLFRNFRFGTCAVFIGKCVELHLQYVNEAVELFTCGNGELYQYYILSE